MYNKLFSSQIKSYYPKGIPGELEDFFNLISFTYDQFEQDRTLLERTIDSSCNEMNELNRSQKKAYDELKRMVENIDEVFFSVSFPTYELLQMSPACLKVYGYSVQEFHDNGKLWYNIVLDEDKKIIDANYKVMLEGKAFSQEYRIYHKSGSIRWLETKITPTLDSDGNLIRLDGITADITVRKRAEEKLYSSELRFRSLIENNADMISMIDETGKFTYISPAVFKLFDYSYEDSLSINAIDVVHPDDIDKVQSFMLEALKYHSVPVSSPDIRLVRKDGKVVWVEGTITNLLEVKGVNSLVANFKDITERKYSSERLIEANENLQLSIDRLTEAQQIAQVGSWLQDVKTNKIHYTPEFYKIFGVGSEEFPSGIDEYLEFFHIEDRERVYENYIQRRIDFKPYQYEARLVLKDGTVKNIIANGKFILNEKGKLIKSHGTVQDVTQHKKAQRELERNIIELKKSNSELDKFVYSVSHDLRAPLSSMLGIIEISQDNTEDEFILHHLNMLKSNIKKLDGFISDILDYSRNSRLEVKKEEINFKDLLNEITKNLKYMNVNSRKVDINYVITENATFQSDKNRLNIVLSNLISNAIRYQNPDASSPCVNILVDITNENLNLKVSDNGIGIPENYHAKIFDMFYRVNESSIGSGLGLYIVKEAITKLKGKIELHSQPGIGSTFNISIPVKQ